MGKLASKLFRESPIVEVVAQALSITRLKAAEPYWAKRERCFLVGCVIWHSLEDADSLHSSTLRKREVEQFFVKLVKMGGFQNMLKRSAPVWCGLSLV